MAVVKHDSPKKAKAVAMYRSMSFSETPAVISAKYKNMLARNAMNVGKFNVLHRPNFTSASQPMKGARRYEISNENVVTLLSASSTSSVLQEKENNTYHTSSNSIFLQQRVLGDLHHCFQRQ